jgi:hypothetical protein
LGVVQVLPTAAARSTVRRFSYAREAHGKRRGIDSDAQLERELALAESTHQGQADPDYRPDASVAQSPEVWAFEQMLVEAE